MSNIVAAKCKPCSKRYGRIIAYRWRSKPGRRISDARCTVKGCGAKLSNTALALAKRFSIREGDPAFGDDRDRPRTHSIRIEHTDTFGEVQNETSFVSSRPWDREENTSDHAIMALSLVWKMKSGDSLNVYMDNQHVDGLDA